MISLDEARRFVLARVQPLTATILDVDASLGCVVAENVVAREPSPRFVNSSMDGFALRARDTANGPVRLRVTTAIFAGDVGADVLGEGEAMRIMTGAPLPPGADSVCLREETTLDPDGSSVLIHKTVRHGEAVRGIGEDIGVGDTLVKSGAILSPSIMGVLASQGVYKILAHARPRVGVLSTGNELTMSHEKLAPGKIRDSNRPSLLASLRESNFVAIDLGVAGDSPSEIAHAFEGGVETCDAIISTGGVSVGDADFVKSVLVDICGANASSMQVAIKPGKPFAFGVTPARGVPIFALAGNPVSTLVGFELFVRPALRRLAGHDSLFRPTYPMVLDCALPRRKDEKTHFVHVYCALGPDGRFHIERAARQGSHLLHALADTNALAIVPDGDGYAPLDEVRAMVLDPEGLGGA